jgi:hypothetical protein
MMIPKFKTPKQLQEIYLDQVGDMSVRNGPLVSNRMRESTRVEVKKKDYVEQSTLVAAPILFQTRGAKTAVCPYNYSSLFVQNMHERALVDKCDDSIYACDRSDVAMTPRYQTLSPSARAWAKETSRKCISDFRLRSLKEKPAIQTS